MNRKESPQEIAARVQARLPAFLNRTPEQVADDERRQELLKASFTRAKSTPEERQIERGVQMETIARQNLELMGEQTKAVTEGHLSRLSYGLELQGRYTEAAEVQPSKRRAKELLDTQAAVDKPDELCDCPREEVEDPLSKQALSISPRRKLRDVYSSKHKALVALIRCDKCGKLNARPLTGQASEIAGAHEGAHRAAQQQRGGGTNDLRILRAKG